MTSRATSISADSTITIHVPGGQDYTILWADAVTDLLAEMVAGSRLVLPQTNEPSTPTLAFGDGNSGFYESVDNTIQVSIAGNARWSWSGTTFRGALGPSLISATPTATTPTVTPNRADPDSGIGWAAADAPNIVAGGVEAQRWTEATGVITAVEADVGLTAHTDSVQGAGIILSSYNVYSTVAVAGDAATLPAVFIVGTLIYVKNDAAVNSMDVFPASGDDAGAGADTAVAVAAGDFAVFMATVANATWTKIMGGTA